MSFPANASRAMPLSPSSAKARRIKPSRLLPWGWLEWFLVAQTFIPALLFLPGISVIRPVIRIASFCLALVAWAAIVQSGRIRSDPQPFGASTWLKVAAGWLMLLIFHFNTNSLLAGFAHALLYIAVFSPVFWAPTVLVSQKQTSRLMIILLVCNGLSALVGLGQVFRPSIFNPPVIQGLQDPNSLSAQILTYQDDYGNKIVRPCGLTDQAGAAAGAGATSALIALALALRPVGFLRKSMCICMAFAGVAVIYYTQVRMILLMFVVCLVVLVVLFALQKNYGYATALGGMSAAIIAGALGWVAATSGWTVVERFLGLFSTNIAQKYQTARGGFITETFDTLVWDYPLGNGLGWWGTIYSVFGDKSVPTKVWVEVMWPAWVIDGGIPLLLIYVVAIVLAICDTLRVALRSKDRELAFWAAVVFASNLSVIATSFSYVTFVTAIGMQFWLLSAVVHASDVRVRTQANAAARAKRASLSAPGPPAIPPSDHESPLSSSMPPPATA